MRLPCWHDEGERKHRREEKEGEIFGSQVKVEPAEVFISVVVPAYNEENRLKGMLEEAVDYLEENYGEQIKESAETNGHSRGNGTLRPVNGSSVNGDRQRRGWEILVISDGSTDKTEATALRFAQNHQLPLHPRRDSGPWTHRSQKGLRIAPGSIRVVRLMQNRGKGGAVTHGMRHVRGEYVVFADADGASKFGDLGRLVAACEKAEDTHGRAVAVGSRAHLVGSDAVVKVCFWATLLKTSDTDTMPAFQTPQFPYALLSRYPAHPDTSGYIPHP